MARPTKYNEEVLEKAKDYIDNHLEQGDEVPSIEGLSYYLSVNRDSLYEWAKEHEAFSDTLSDIKSKQAKLLINGGLVGDYNASIAKLMLYNHGYSEKQETKHSGDINFIAGKSELGRV